MPPSPERLSGAHESDPRREAIDTTHTRLGESADALTEDLFKPGGRVHTNVRLLQQNPQAFREGIARESLQRILKERPAIMSALPPQNQFPAQIPEGRDPRAYKDFEVDKITARLQDVLIVNQYGDAPKADRDGYLWLGKTRATNGKNVPNQTFYHVNVANVQKDINLLTRAKERFPESAPQLDRMIAALKPLGYADPSSLRQENFAQAKKNTPANKMLKHAGTLGGVVLLGGATILAGISSLVNRQVSIAPFLYASGLLFLINRDLLVGKSRAQIQETVSILGNRTFVIGMAPRYEMAGPHWADVFESLMIPRSAKALREFENSPKGNAEAEQLAKELLPNWNSAPPDVRQKLTQLIRNQAHFTALRRWLSEVHSKPSRDIVTGYIRQGSWKAAGMMGSPPRSLYQNPPDLRGLEDLGEGIHPGTGDSGPRPNPDGRATA
jgi:hypothetical protein